MQTKIEQSTIIESIQHIRRSKVDHEFRTMMVPGLIDGDDLIKIAQVLAGSKRYVLHGFKPGDTLSPECQGISGYSSNEMAQFRDIVTPYYGEVLLRI